MVRKRQILERFLWYLYLISIQKILLGNTLVLKLPVKDVAEALYVQTKVVGSSGFALHFQERGPQQCQDLAPTTSEPASALGHPRPSSQLCGFIASPTSTWHQSWAPLASAASHTRTWPPQVGQHPWALQPTPLALALSTSRPGPAQDFQGQGPAY